MSSKPALPSSLTNRITKEELTIYTPPLTGASLIGKSISIEEFLLNRLSNELFDDPLTDYDDTDYGDTDQEDTLPVEVAPLPRPGSSKGPKLAPLSAFPFSQKGLKEKERLARRRRRKREKQQAEDGTELKQVAKRRRVEAVKETLLLDFNVGEDIEVTKPGWIGKRVADLPCREFTKQELVNLKMTPFPWDGRTTHLLLDAEKHVVGVLLGQPRDIKAWEGVHDAAYRALQEAAGSMNFSDKELRHRRGAFPAVAHGISFGGGQEEPKHLSHGSRKKDAILDGLMQEKSIQRICKFASRGFETYSERNYAYMKSTMEELRAHYDSSKDERRKLRRPYDSAIGVFPCRSLNLGKQSVSFPHTDEGNLAQSWCSITPIGRFNSSKGGQLVLWDFGLVIDFPAGSTALIPSALIRHSNATISPGETRYSIIQYASGGLYRWVHNGFMSEGDWKARASQKDCEMREIEQRHRWKDAVGMFTKLDEILPKLKQDLSNSEARC